MKKCISVRTLTWLLLLAMIAAGCQKDEETPQFESLSFNSEEVLAKLPEGLKNSDDDYAQQCVDYIESAVDMSSFVDNMAPPEDARKTSKKSTMNGDTWSWTWSYMGESFTFYWSYDEDNQKRYWSMDIQYGDGPVYDYIDAWEMKDGSEGEVTYHFYWAYLYEGEPLEEYEDYYWKYTWSLDSEENYYFNWYVHSGGTQYEYELHYDIMIYADGSGYIDYYSMDELFYHMKWDAMGNGSWAYYLGGSFSMSGEWTAG